jgi:hypothetical protein
MQTTLTTWKVEHGKRMDTRIRGYAYDARLALHQPAFTYYAALSTCVYDIGMLLMMILPALKGKMAGFFTRLCAYDGPHLLTADYSISPSAIQHPSSSTPPIYVYTASQNLNDNADNCSFSQYDSNYDPSQCTTSASDVTMIYAYDANGNVTDLVGTNGESILTATRSAKLARWLMRIRSGSRRSIWMLRLGCIITATDFTTPKSAGGRHGILSVQNAIYILDC